MKKLTVLVSLILTLAFNGHRTQATALTTYDISSPNGRIQVKIQTGERITYDVLVAGKSVIQNSTLSIDIDHKTLGLNPVVKADKTSSVDREIISPVPIKSTKIREAYKELRLELEGNYAIVFRAYNEGFAYRIETTVAQSQVKV